MEDTVWVTMGGLVMDKVFTQVTITIDDTLLNLTVLVFTFLGGSIFDNPYSLEGNYGGYGNYGMMSPYSMNDYGGMVYTKQLYTDFNLSNKCASLGMYGSPNGMGIVRPLRKQAKSLVQRDVYDNKDFKGTLASSEDSFPEESSGANSAVILTMDQLLKK